MAGITVPIKVDLPDNWLEMVVDRLRNDPDGEWAQVIRCKDCKLYGDEKCLMRFDGHDWAEPDGFCHMAERKEQWEK